MITKARARTMTFAGALLLTSVLGLAQTQGTPEEFTAVAIASDEFGSGAGTVIMRITRWSTEAERMRLVNTLQSKGSSELLDELQEMRPVGTIRTPDSLAYDLRYAHETRGEDGGRQIVIATDRPIGFWEAANNSRTLDYPFTVIQMQMGADGKGKGTMSYATRIRARGNVIELENFSTARIMLNDIEARKKDD
jgi:hypothetical protein